MFAAMNGFPSRGSLPQYPRSRVPQGSRQSSPTSARGVRFTDEEKPLMMEALELARFVCVTGCMGVCFLGLVTVLIVLYVTIRPFSKSVYRRLVAQLGSSAFLDAAALLLPSVKIILTGDSDVPSPVGTSLLVSNHVLEGDWWGLLMLGRSVGLRGTLKVFLRNEFLNINMDSMEDPRTRSAAALSVSSSSSLKVLSNGNENGGSPSSTASSTASGGSGQRYAPYDISVMGKLLHTFLDFPLINHEDCVADREQLFSLLRSFAEDGGAAAPVQLLLFPEGWSVHSGVDRFSLHAKSNDFAKRESRPELKHLLLPRNRAFRSSLECLRESSPVVYDVTMAYRGYDGSLPPSPNISIKILWDVLRCKYPKQIHLRVKRYSMEEVLQDSSWLDKKWVEKDRMLAHFARHHSFPTSARRSSRPRVFETKYSSVENSLVSLLRLGLIPCSIPLLLLMSIPIFWTLVGVWLFSRLYALVFPDNANNAPRPPSGTLSAAPGTPYCPATPFASPKMTSWTDMLRGQ